MKTIPSDRTALNARTVNVIISVLVAMALLFSGGCEKSVKTGPASSTNASHQLNNQEQTLVGAWRLRNTETYEVAGTDSTGQCNCNLLSSISCDSMCVVQFFGSMMGSGSIGGCDANAGFSWSVPQQNVLQTNTASFTIINLSHDSVILSTDYMKDILRLRSVYHYTRK